MRREARFPQRTSSVHLMVLVAFIFALRHRQLHQIAFRRWQPLPGFLPPKLQNVSGKKVELPEEWVHAAQNLLALTFGTVAGEKHGFGSVDFNFEHGLIASSSKHPASCEASCCVSLSLIYFLFFSSQKFSE